MSEIAFNVNGEPFEVPSAMAAWRVRKLKPKGAPEVVYGRDGLPLFLPMEADIEDLRREARGEGRYRLDPVDDHNRPLPNTQASYVCVHSIERAPELVAPTVSAAAIHADTTTQLVSALLESQKQHTELARMYVSQFPVLVNALSGVVRSAGDAGLPARVPLVVPVAPEVKPAEQASSAKDSDEDDDDEEEDDDEDDDEGEEVEGAEAAPESGWNWPRVAGSALEKLGPQLESLVGGIPALAATLGGAMRIKKPAAKTTEPASGAPAADIGAHLIAIRAALTPEEGAMVMTLANELSMADKLTYFEKLRGMSVPEAVAYVRAELAGLARSSAHGAAGPEAASEPGLAMSEDDFDAHFDAICAAMTPEEGKTVRLMYEELVFEHRLIWAEKLSRMSVPQGVAFFRRQLAAAGFNTPEQSAIEARIVRAANAARVPGTAPSATATPHRDGRRAAGSSAPSKPPTGATGGAPIAGLSTVSPGTQSQIAAIQRELTPDEDLAMRRHVAALSPAERSAWIATLLVLPVPEAVAMIRERLAEDRPRAGQRDATAIPGAPHAPATAAQPAQRKHTTLAPESPRSSSAEVAVPHDGPRVREDRTMPTRLLSSSAEVAVVREELPERHALPAVALAASGSLEARAPHHELPTRNALPGPASAALASPEARAPHHELPTRNALPPSATAALVSPKTRMPHEEQAAPATPADREPLVRAEVLLSTDATPSVSMPSAPPRRVDMDADTHLLAIERALTDGERFLVHAMIAQLPTDERWVWQDKLLSVPVAEAAAILRLAIQELTAGTVPVDPRVGGVPDPLDLAPAHDRTFADGQQPGDSGALDDNLEHDDEQASDADGQLEEDQELVDGQDLDDEGELDGGQELDDEERLDDGREFDDEQPDVDRGLDHRVAMSGSAGASAAPTAPVSFDTVPTGGLPTLSPDAFSHFKRIEAALTFAERMRVYELGAQLSATEVTAWIAELAPLPLPEAVAKVRAALAAADSASHNARTRGVS